MTTLKCNYPGCIGEHGYILYKYEKGTQDRKQYCLTHYDRMHFAEMSKADAERDINYRKRSKLSANKQ